MNDLEKRDHEYALSQSKLHGKRILRSDSSKDVTFTFVGGGIAGLVAMYGCRLLHIHNEILSLAVVITGVIIGLVAGGFLFNRFFVKDKSWRPSLFDRSWDEYRNETFHRRKR